MRTKHIFIIVFILLLQFYCGSNQPSSPGDDELNSVPRITASNVKSRLDTGETITIVDVRSKADYDNGHIPGALYVPSAEVKNQLQRMPKEYDTVFYCT